MKKILMFIFCCVVVFGLTGCNNGKQKEIQSNSNDNAQPKSNILKAVDEIITDSELENIHYRLERVNGDYLFFIRNDNNSTIALKITIDFYKDNQFVFKKSESINFFRPNSVGVRNIEDYPYEYDDYKVTFDVTDNSDYEDYSQYITFKEEVEDNELKIKTINNSNNSINVFAFVVFYKNNKIVAYDYGSSGGNRRNIISHYPKDENNNKISYDRYEIYLDSAYVYID